MLRNTVELARSAIGIEFHKVMPSVALATYLNNAEKNHLSSLQKSLDSMFEV